MLQEGGEEEARDFSKDPERLGGNSRFEPEFLRRVNRDEFHELSEEARLELICNNSSNS